MVRAWDPLAVFFLDWFLDRNYRYKSVGTQTTHYTWLVYTGPEFLSYRGRAGSHRQYEFKEIRLKALLSLELCDSTYPESNLSVSHIYTYSFKIHADIIFLLMQSICKVFSGVEWAGRDQGNLSLMADESQIGQQNEDV